MEGKAYMHSAKSKRNESDLYHTPKSLVWELLKREKFERVWEPACGNGAISDELDAYGILELATDVSMGFDFLSDSTVHMGDILTNPPFSLWDEFVMHAKSHCTGRVCMLGRTDCFGAHSRNVNGIWDQLEKIYIFDRRIDYRTPLRDDGLFHVGAMVTGWFIWDTTQPAETKWSGNIIDVQKYAKLGACHA